MNEIFNALVFFIRDVFGDTTAWVVGNSVSFAILGAFAVALKLLGVI